MGSEQAGLPGMVSADLRLGRWQDVLADVECDAWISDPPYGERTHRGHDAIEGTGDRSGLGYAFLRPSGVRTIVEHWAPRTRGWFCVMSCSDLAAVWRAELERIGRYAFAPIPVVVPGGRVRLSGDGPSSYTDWLTVARPRTREHATWGTLPGHYQRSCGDERSGRVGGKPLGVMRAIVRDYSRPGDLVCDPFAGNATTLLAALMENRCAIGSECDPRAYADARKRLAQGYTPDLFEGRAIAAR